MCLGVFFTANLVPSAIDMSFKDIIEEVDTSDARLTMYFIPGIIFLLMLWLRKYLFVMIGSRLCILIGSFIMTAGCYFFWPFPRKEDSAIG